ncbi:hypothetical protein WJX72_002577 [[Myrmecia] bisecta]|uniref:ERCC4 domain-containing protein n=1 Tax=[Myrmecia] bisecta TaxID=41462 RepID=A0AAW1PES5_9CHLO
MSAGMGWQKVVGVLLHLQAERRRAIRLYRATNQQGSVRAFSDQPTSFAAGFAKVEKVMKALFLRRLYLWPRYEASVKESLDKEPCEVVDLALRLTPAMAAIYDAIAELMDSCIKELRRSNKIDTTDLTLENGLLKNFDELVRRQLDAVWHTVSHRTRQVVADLRTLRALADFLLRLDAVTFLTYLDTLRATEGTTSLWLFHDAAHTIFEQAKRRVYVLQRGSDGETGSNEVSTGDVGSEPTSGVSRAARILPVLEELPKWAVVGEALQEIQTEQARLLEEAEGAGGDQEGASRLRQQAAQAAVLVVAQEVQTCRQLRQVVQPGGAQCLLQQAFQAYLVNRLQARSGKGGGAGSGKGGRPSGAGRGRGRGRGRYRGQKGGRPRVGPQAVISGSPSALEEQALLREAQQLVRQAAAQGGPARSRKRRKIAPSQRAASAGTNIDADVEQPGQEDRSATDGRVLFSALERREEGILWEVQPAFIVMVDPDVAFVRQLEVYKAERPGWPVRVYHLHYEDSQEADRYRALLAREVSVFSDLIKQKEFMVLPDLAQDLAQAVAGRQEREASMYHPDVLAALPPGPSNALSRRGGRQADRPVPHRLVVDVREFMSSLPAVLHQQGLEITPVTLEVGDYVLSPDMCVERKSLSDLKSSFVSGRLFHQAEAMSKHYKLPVLLVEFERDKAFVLHAATDITDDIQVGSLVSKLVLLTLHFPRLRIIWSRSLHATADIFRTLKANQDEPDPITAASVGVPVGPDGLPLASGEAVVNSGAVDLLRRLPGVTEANFRPLMAAAPSLADLACMPLDDLEAAMGGRTAAQKLHTWLAAATPTLP